jgi:hypothetical protein
VKANSDVSVSSTLQEEYPAFQYYTSRYTLYGGNSYLSVDGGMALVHPLHLALVFHYRGLHRDRLSFFLNHEALLY